MRAAAGVFQYAAARGGAADTAGGKCAGVCAAGARKAATGTGSCYASHVLERVGPRLKQRAARRTCTVSLQLDENIAHQEFTTDQAVVEQILFNLVDNAAKYAREATDRRIHVETGGNGKYVNLTVRDHGPGIKNGMWSRPMQPFGKVRRNRPSRRRAWGWDWRCAGDWRDNWVGGWRLRIRRWWCGAVVVFADRMKPGIGARSASTSPHFNHPCSRCGLRTRRRCFDLPCRWRWRYILILNLMLNAFAIFSLSRKRMRS